MNDNFELPKLVDNVDNKVEEPKETTMDTPKEIKYEYSLNGLFKYLTTQDTKELFMVLIRLIIIAGIIIVFHLPISIIKELGINIITFFHIEISDFILNLWYFICEGAYLALAIFAFVKIVKTRYINLVLKKGE